jgi:hypothetical protein
MMMSARLAAEPARQLVDELGAQLGAEGLVGVVGVDGHVVARAAQGSGDGVAVAVEGGDDQQDVVAGQCHPIWCGRLDCVEP